MKTIKPTRGPVATKTIFGNIVDDIKELEKQLAATKAELVKLKNRARIQCSGNLNGTPATCILFGENLTPQ